jgi:hypothetical protein
MAGVNRCKCGAGFDYCREIFLTIYSRVMSLHLARDPGKPFAEPVEKTTELIETLVRNCECVLVKKLANNDRNWAVWDEEKKRYKSNQAGVLLPANVRERGFFPPLTPDIKKPHNRSVAINVYWPATGNVYESRFIWYSGKGLAENHWTTSPRSEFSYLAPASFVLLFKPKDPHANYRALTVDSADELLCDYLDEIFGTAAPDFSFSIFQADAVDLTPALTALQKLVEQLMLELAKGPAALDIFVKSLSKRSPQAIAAEAYSEWRQASGNENLNPYLLSTPGDVLYELTRQREFAIYKQDEAAYYGPHLVRALYGDGRGRSMLEVVTSLVENFEVFYRICLSAGQTRKSRAGGSFETHVAKMLLDGDVPHFAQPIFDGRKPDFVLPSRELYSDVGTSAGKSLVLTLKTTLRERWTQVVSESTGCPIFLATLDENVPNATLDKLAKVSVKLVVPERFKMSYGEHSSVITFREFFENLKSSMREVWAAAGLRSFRAPDER